MKKIIVILVLFISMNHGLFAQDAIDKYFQKYADDNAFTAVFISEYMFSLFANVEADNPEDKEVMEILKGLTSLHVLTTEKNGLKYYEEAIKMLNTNEYKTLMTVKEEGTKVQFLIRKEGNQVKELLLLVGEKDEFVLLSIVGNIALDKISKLAKHMDVKGLEHLDKVEEK